MPENFVTSFARALTASGRPPRKRAGRDSVQGSARVDKIGEKDRNKAPSSSGWQKQLWAYYDEVGELHYTMSFIGACLSRCILTIGLPDEEGHVGPVFDEDGKVLTNDDGSARPELARAEEALQLVRSLRSDIGGQPQLLRSVGINLGLAGEFYLVGTPDTEVEDVANVPLIDLNWEVLSSEEFRPKEDHYERIRKPGGTPEQIDKDRVHAIRIWRSHPRFTELPDSSVRAVIDILDELVLLTREVRGEALSRIANAGILLVPDEIDYPDDDAADDDEDPFTRDLIATMSTAISDKASAAGVVPFVVRAPGDHLTPDRFRHIDLPVKSSDSAAKRSETVQRYAQGVDLPVEIVTGHADTTFANAVQIDDSLFKSHIEPILEIFCDGLTAGLLRPALGDEVPFVIHYDSGELVARPNRAQDAKDVYQLGELSGKALRSATGFSETDAPDDEERATRAPVVPITGNPTGNEGNGQDGPGSNGPGSPNLQGEQSLAAAIEAATEVTVERAIQRAGARLRSKANSQPAIRDQLSQVPDVEVAITLGPSLVKRLEQGDLFHREFDTLWSVVTRRTGDQNFADALRTACAEIAGERLYQPRMPFPFHRLPNYSERAVLRALPNG